jgi:hypothetical protein
MANVPSGETCVQSDLPRCCEPDGEPCEACFASQKDREWFAAHPRQDVYVRRAFPGEAVAYLVAAGGTDPETYALITALTVGALEAEVRVTQTEPGRRLKCMRFVRVTGAGRRS